MNFLDLKPIFFQYQLDFDEQVVALLNIYWDKVKAASTYMDLTKITSEEEAWAKHFLDSYAPLFFQKTHQYEIEKIGGNGMDIGTGAGFPGVPLGLYYSKMTWYLIDARSKKINFLTDTLKEMQQTQFIPMHTRIEDLTLAEEYLKGSVHVITARAIKLETDLLKVIYDLLAQGGLLIQYAGPTAGALPFHKGKLLKEVADISPRLHVLTENHRIRIFQKA